MLCGTHFLRTFPPKIIESIGHVPCSHLAMSLLTSSSTYVSTSPLSAYKNIPLVFLYINEGRSQALVVSSNFLRTKATKFKPVVHKTWGLISRNLGISRFSKCELGVKYLRSFFQYACLKTKTLMTTLCILWLLTFFHYSTKQFTSCGTFLSAFVEKMEGVKLLI